MNPFSMVRYRFFLFAGLLPYLLGSGWAYGRDGVFSWNTFWIGLLGIFLSVCGVEAFNEFYDSRLGTDRVFNPDDEDPIPDWVLPAGWAAFLLAGVVGAYLAWTHGWPVVLYMGLGAVAAIFYVGPPFRWAYRGLGESMIALSYGPWMTLGAYFIHTGRFSWAVLLASLVPGFLIVALAVANEIPDFYQDRMVGKRNLVVRFGRENGVRIYQTFAAIGTLIPALGAALGLFPLAVAPATLALGLIVLSGKRARATYENPREFIPAVRALVSSYIVATTLFTVGVTWG